jgi:TetR/AcrR family transcriptional regulator
MPPAPPIRRPRTRPGPQRASASGHSAETTRHTLFDTAAQEFAAHGFAGTRVDRIAAGARLNKAMIYYHFGSKAGLYTDILRDMFSAVGARVRAVATSSATPEEKIRRFVEAIAIEAEARPHFPRIWFREIADGGKHLDKQTLREVAGIVKTLAAFIDEGVKRGVFLNVAPLLVHAGIVGPLLLFFASRALRERLASAGIGEAVQFDRAQVVGHIQDVALGVLTGTASTARPNVKVRKR